MAVLSCFALKNIKKIHVAKEIFNSCVYASKSKIWNNVPVRNCHDRTLLIRSSRYQYRKFKDLFHLYLMVGSIPLIAIITYVNIFIGPATLALIPEGYEPKPWEHYRHPITRFLAKYFMRSPHEVHERSLHNIFFSHEKTQLNLLRNKIVNMMKERQDYQAWYFDRAVVKYGRKKVEDIEEIKKGKGISNNWIQ